MVTAHPAMSIASPKQERLPSTHCFRETCQTAETESRDIDMALAFIHYLPPQERVTLLTQRLEALQPRYDSLIKSATQLKDDHSLLPWVAQGVQHSLGRVAFEREWMRTVIASVADWPTASESKKPQ
ncbi:MAG: hypothetical protein QM758_01765 [Armatimonas sp.]